MRLLLTILFALCLISAHAQENAQSSNFQELMNDFAALQERHTANQVLLTKLGNDLRDLPKSPTPTDYLKNALKLKKRLVDATADVQRENENQVIFKNSITAYSGNHKLLKQEQTYLSLYLDDIQKYGREQDTATQQLKNALVNLNEEIDKFPPPVEFTCSQGISFILFSPSFYITKTPLTAEQFISIVKTSSQLSDEDAANLKEHFIKEGLTISESRMIAAKLGQLCGFECTLPNEDQLKYLENYAMELKQALWLEGKDMKDVKTKEALQRFGMTMARVWDPRSVLAKSQGRETVYNELPWMNYPALGCALIAEASAGKNALLAEIELAIAEEEAAEAAKPLQPVQAESNGEAVEKED